MMLTTLLAAATLAGIHAKDLTPLKDVETRDGEIVWVENGKAAFPIVADQRNPLVARAAKFLKTCVKEMTGIEPRLVPAAAAKGVEKAVFVVSDAKPGDESFTTTVSDGAVRFSGAAYHAAYDFAERELGVRQYWPAKDGGISDLARIPCHAAGGHV